MAVAAFRSQRSENCKPGLTARAVAWRGVAQLDSLALPRLASSVYGSRRVNFVRGLHLIMKSGKMIIKCVNVNIQCIHKHFGSRPKSNIYAGGVVKISGNCFWAK